MRLFVPAATGVLIDRPNRYLLRVRVGSRSVEAHCPNPGRMGELLLPGRRVILQEHAGRGRRTRYTAAACHYRGRIVPLDSGRANAVARELVLPRLFGLDARVRPEVRVGSSRLDFALELGDGRRAYLEVKTCTLVEHGVAMFPDAETARGLRHLEALAACGPSVEAHLLFLLMNPTASVFVPNAHTDPRFVRRLLELKPHLTLHASSIRCSANGIAKVADARVPMDLERAQGLLGGGGTYLLLLELARARSVLVGSLGRLRLEAGIYAYVGSALRGLEARLGRHARRRKRLHWHVDYLRERCRLLESFPVAGVHRLECALAADMRAIAKRAIPRFGSSDCDCGSHLFHFPSDPRSTPEFWRVICRYRHVEALRSPHPLPHFSALADGSVPSAEGAG